MALYLTEADIAPLITMDDTLIVLEDLFAARARGEIVNRPRMRVPIQGGTYNVMPAGWLARGVVGQKVYTATAKGASFQILLHAADGSGLLAVMAGGRISGLRTGGVTGLAARALGGDAVGGPVAVIGSGFQATMQVTGIVAATGARDVRVWSRSAEKREPFAERLAASLGVDVRATATVDQALDGAAIVVTITNAPEPVLTADQVRPGMTLIAAGNNTWLRSEIDPAIFGRADLVVVDDLPNAQVEAGELMRAAELGHVSWDRVVALGDIIGGARAGRTGSGQLVVCELQGIGIEDVAVAELVLRRARERGVGLELPA
jgi:ornithine cyclodeaminase/alanine dehydrogenase-like protein (mu-crystallin family)